MSRTAFGTVFKRVTWYRLLVSVPMVENVIISRPWPPVPLSSSVNLIELGSIGTVTSSAVPRTPSGPALINWIDAALKCV